MDEEDNTPSHINKKRNYLSVDHRINDIFLTGNLDNENILHE